MVTGLDNRPSSRPIPLATPPRCRDFLRLILRSSRATAAAIGGHQPRGGHVRDRKVQEPDAPECIASDDGRGADRDAPVTAVAAVGDTAGGGGQAPRLWRCCGAA